jgi:hypothetical protein
VTSGQTPVLDPSEARALLDSIDTSTVAGLRDHALIGLMVYSFARISAALGMAVEDVFTQNRRLWVRLREKGGKRHAMPCHHNLDEYLIAYLDSGGLRGDPKGPPFRTIGRGTGRLKNGGTLESVSVRKYVRVFTAGGVEALFANRRRIGGRLADNEATRQAVFALLHEPPSASGINRTTWRMADLTQVLRERGTPVCAQVVREITRSAGWQRPAAPTRSGGCSFCRSTSCRRRATWHCASARSCSGVQSTRPPSNAASRHTGGADNHRKPAGTQQMDDGCRVRPGGLRVLRGAQRHREIGVRLCRIRQGGGVSRRLSRPPDLGADAQAPRAVAGGTADRGPLNSRPGKPLAMK